MTHWLARLTLNPQCEQARRDATGPDSPVHLHRRVMSLYPDDAGPDPRARFGVLYRAEETPTGVHLIIQSNHRPDPGRLPHGYGTLVTSSLDPLLDALKPGRHIHYRCVASAVRKPGATTRAAYNLPAVVPLKGTAAAEWWMRQAEKTGITAHTAHHEPIDPVNSPRPGDDRRAPRIRHNRTRFEGTATVTDPDLLRTKIIEGIGRGKPYGCGLLSIAPARRPA
ncbi:type I-E CRISPR-associated protein Cas6/Cse3/CasE [Streptomyces sp. ST2-7A]|uniref:type I-E CRISPR-associated protein Cas6/Cse3/CasE n=1 Tax=Streptomyces sp. ST2-7A TaxID=2907214 RepID=UPI001F214EAE|nr:type I-E CRISPR-associated protein Cas6/Cse3/CasE [Streptomyces sp. ST2-7A]MCE7081672.1 type I-E CRISPR-associated protein Cas6/Cse3/CasE [Streptomyces sp. ST2-7A]